MTTAGRLIALLIVIGALIVGAHVHLTSADGCPAGSSPIDTSLTLTCDASGAVRCVEWAAGFTPVPSRDASLTYSPRRAPDVGPWCAGATAPPFGV